MTEDVLPWYARSLPEGGDPAAEIAALRARIAHIGAALDGENEGIRLWMLDCGHLVDKHREHAAEVSVKLDRVRELADSWTEPDGAGDLADRIVAIIDGGRP